MTLTAITNAQSYNWSDWLIGIMRSFFSGGAGALVALSASTVLKLSLKQTLLLTFSQFVIMGLYRLGEFLQLHGAPDKLQVALNTAQAGVDQAGAAIQDAKVAATTDKP